MIIVVAAFLFSILSLSFFKEIPKVDKFLERFPVLMSLIPSWGFFAPVPGMHDYHLLYRGIDKQEEVQDWQEAFPVKEKRSLFAFIWNPDKKHLKGLLDMVQNLLRFCTASNEKQQICLSISYLHILNYVSSLEHDKSVERIQFMILEGSRLYDLKVAFVSSTHPLPDR